MKKICKTLEPASLTSYRSKIQTVNLEDINIYEDYPQKTQDGCKDTTIKNNLRKKLLEEQGYICCYCMSRVDCENSKIEHFKPQSKYRNLQIDYQNLFLSCCGGEGSSKNQQFCDTKKGDEELQKINLLTNIEESLIYQKSESDQIKINSNDTSIQEDIKLLNLNISLLAKNRKEAYNTVIANLKKRGFNRQNYQKAMRHYQNGQNGKYEPFCEMIVYFLTEKLKSKGK